MQGVGKQEDGKQGVEKQQDDKQGVGKPQDDKQGVGKQQDDKQQDDKQQDGKQQDDKQLDDKQQDGKEEDDKQQDDKRKDDKQRVGMQQGVGKQQDDKQGVGKQQDGKQGVGKQQDDKEQDDKQQDGKQQDGKQQDGKEQDGKQGVGKQGAGKQQDGKEQDDTQQDDKQQDDKQEQGKEHDGKEQNSIQQDGKQGAGKQQDGKQGVGKKGAGKQGSGKQQDGKQPDDKEDGRQEDDKKQDGRQRVGKHKAGKQENGKQQNGKQEDGKEQEEKYEMENTTDDEVCDGDEGESQEDPLPPPPLPPKIPPPRPLTGPKRKRTTDQKNNDLVVLCCNIEGLSRNITGLRNVATEYRPHLILCSETWVTTQNPTQFEIPGYDSAFAPATTSEKGGRPSGGMVEYERSPRWGSLMLQDNDEVGQRVRYATLHVPKLNHSIKFFHVYGPQQASEDKVIAFFYNSLSEQISSSNSTSAVIMGDFNAPLTKESLPPTSNAGTQLSRLISKHSLKTTTLLYKDIAPFTFVGPRGGTSVIDHVLTTRSISAHFQITNRAVRLQQINSCHVQLLTSITTNSNLPRVNQGAFKPLKAESWQHFSSGDHRWITYGKLVTSKIDAIAVIMNAQLNNSESLETVWQARKVNQKRTKQSRITKSKNPTTAQPMSGENYCGVRLCSSLPQTTTEKHYWNYATITTTKRTTAKIP
jgi:hypothetical protein